MWALGCVLYEIWTQDSSFVEGLCGMATSLGKMPELITKIEDLAIVVLLCMSFVFCAIFRSYCNSRSAAHRA
jgi:hypothetical protein